MRLNVHDFSGHPFQVQLSRELAARGHEVVHNFSSQFVTGRGRLTVGPDDPSTLRIEEITCQVPLVKYQPLGRTRFEISYAKAWCDRIAREDFDVVVACNVPLFTLARTQGYLARHRQPWVLWHQDLYSLGVAAEAARRLPGALADTARVGVQRLEQAQVRGASAVVPITGAMVDQYLAWGIDRPGVHVLPNWAPLDDVVPGERDNAWAREQNLPVGPARIVYAGTLGRKHNPLLLLELLDAVQERGQDAILVVASEGCGADDLAEAAAGRDDVRIVGFQPAERLGEMLASADVVVALLEPDAARFSVPSKVLTYLAAGRPIVALMPDGNPAADDVEQAGGFVGPPETLGAKNGAEWIESLLSIPDGVARLGARARAMAERRFDIERIADVFENVLEDAVARSRSTRRVGGVPVGRRRV